MALASCSLHVSLHGSPVLQYSGQIQGGRNTHQPAAIHNRTNAVSQACNKAALISLAGPRTLAAQGPRSIACVSPATFWKPRLYRSHLPLRSSLEYMLRSSLTPGRSCPSYVALSSGLATHAAWTSFGVSCAPAGNLVCQRSSRKSQKNVIKMDMFDAIFDFLADGVRRTAAIIGSVIIVLALGSFSFVPSGECQSAVIRRLHQSCRLAYNHWKPKLN